MIAAIRVEWSKLWRSGVIRFIGVVSALVIPLMAFGLFFVAVEGGFGPLAVKAEGLVQGEGWDGYFDAVGQISAAALFLATGVATAWVFGREFVDRTFLALFAVATRRSSVAIGKFVALGTAGVILSVAFVVVTAAVGALAMLEVGEVSVLAGLTDLLISALLTTMLGMTVGYVASIGRGYLAGIGAVILLVAAAQIAVLLGTGGWFPYAVPGLLAVGDGETVPMVEPIQILLVPILLAVAIAATARWWSSAEVV